MFIHKHEHFIIITYLTWAYKVIASTYIKHAYAYIPQKKLILPSVYNQLVDYPTLVQTWSMSQKVMDELQQVKDLLREKVNRLKSHMSLVINIL